MVDWFDNIKSQLSANQIPALDEIKIIRQQVSERLDLASINGSVDQRRQVFELVSLVLTHDELKTPTLLESVAQVLFQPTVVDQPLLDLVVFLHQETRSDHEIQDKITSFFTTAIRSASSYQQLRLLVNTVIHLASTTKLIESSLQFLIEQTTFEKLVPRLVEVEHALEISNQLQWLRHHATDSGRHILYIQLIQLIHKPKLENETFHIVLDFAFTPPDKPKRRIWENAENYDQSQEESFQKVCIERIVDLLADSSTSFGTLGLLVSFWPLIRQELRMLLVQLLPEKIDLSQDWSEMLAEYDPASTNYEQIYHMLLEMASYCGLSSEADMIQIPFVKLILQLTRNQNELRSILREPVFFQQLRPRSIWLISVWFLLRPLAELIPQSKTGQIVSSLGLPTATFPSQSTFLFVFEYLLLNQETSEGTKTANQSAQMKRALLNAMAQLLDSKIEKTNRACQVLQEYLQGYLRGVGDVERQSWRALAEQVWLVDTNRPTADVDRIRNPEVNRQLQQQIKIMLNEPNG